MVEALEDVRVATHRATEMTRRLVSFARRDEVSRTEIDLSEVVAEVLALLCRSFGRGLTLQGDIEPGLRICGDRGQLFQMLINLCINARDATPEDGTIGVELARTDESTVMMRVSDSGVGMTEAIRERLFEPFFTTKAGERGAGLGLATVYEAVMAHGGNIDVKSAPNQGATFTIYLPSTERSSEEVQTQAPPKRKPVPTSVRPLRILLVDDEAVMRRSARRLLQLLGHSVVEAQHGLEALERLEAPDDFEPNVVILDLDMPQMGGVECFARLRAVRPQLPVIIASGYLDPTVSRELTTHGAFAVMRKPYERHELEGVLARIAGNPATRLPTSSAGVARSSVSDACTPSGSVPRKNSCGRSSTP